MVSKPAAWSPYRKQMEEFERRLFQGAMDSARQIGAAPSVSRVSSMLGVTREFTRKRLQALGLRAVPEPENPERTENRRQASQRARAALAKQREAMRKADEARAAAEKHAREVENCPAEPEKAEKPAPAPGEETA